MEKTKTDEIGHVEFIVYLTVWLVVIDCLVVVFLVMYNAGNICVLCTVEQDGKLPHSLRRACLKLILLKFEYSERDLVLLLLGHNVLSVTAQRIELQKSAACGGCSAVRCSPGQTQMMEGFVFRLCL